MTIQTSAYKTLADLRAKRLARWRAPPQKNAAAVAPTLQPYEFHPLAALFPLLEGDAFAALCASIKANGQQDAIILIDDGDGGQKILDGRNRYRACLAMGRTPFFTRFRGDNPLGFVLAKNLDRRHLDASQRAMVAARIANLGPGRPRLADLEAGLRDIETQALHDDEAGAHAQIGYAKTSRNQGVSGPAAAALLNVGKGSVELARGVVRDGAPELVAAVERGAIAVSNAADIASLPREEQALIVARGEKEILAKAKEIRAEKSGLRREGRLSRIGAAHAASRGLETAIKYPVIYADPPWRYEAGDSTRSTENHYPTMPLEEIAALPIGDLATPDALLFLWVRTSLTHDPRIVPMIAAWGFRVVSQIIWDKQNIGMGFWARERHEPLLICKRGDFPAPAPGVLRPSVIGSPRGKVSEKPDAFYEMIEAYTPGLARIELFARLTPHGKSAREGWAVWGNEAGVSDAQGE